MGKTRLVLEAAGRLPGDPAALVGRCLPYGNGSTFWPLAEVVRQAAGIGLEAAPAPIEEAVWSTRRLLEALAAAFDQGR